MGEVIISIEQHKLNFLVTRYRDLLNQAIVNTPVKSVEDPQASPAHLRWMLQEIELNPDQSLTKKHRWLSWVSACLILVYKVTNVPTERDATRGILNGS